MKITIDHKLYLLIGFLLIRCNGFSQKTYPPIKYTGYEMCIYKKGDTTCKWDASKGAIQLNFKSDTIFNITLSRSKSVTYIVNKKTKSYTEVMTDGNKVYWDIYDVYDTDLIEPITIKLGIFDWAEKGQTGAISIISEDFTVVFKLK